MNVLQDRNPLYVRLSDGGVRNGYTIKLLNKRYLPRAFKLSVEGLPGARLTWLGMRAVSCRCRRTTCNRSSFT
ncbi:MAG: FixG Ig-like domain-containing protein [Hyphomicrobiales bacterium]